MRTGLIVIVGASAVLAGCIGIGEGSVTGTANIPLCRMSGAYDLHASFYGANRFGSTLHIRVQNGGGTEEYSDNFRVTIDDTNEVAAQLATSAERDAEGRPVVTFPVGPDNDPRFLVHAVLSPNWSCGRRKSSTLGEAVGLWARNDSAHPSTITFASVDLSHSSTASSGRSDDERFTEVTAFHIWLHDPRRIGPTATMRGLDPNATVGEAEMSGSFKFHYSLQRPAQYFSP